MLMFACGIPDVSTYVCRYFYVRYIVGMYYVKYQRSILFDPTFVITPIVPESKTLQYMYVPN